VLAKISDKESLLSAAAGFRDRGGFSAPAFKRFCARVGALPRGTFWEGGGGGGGTGAVPRVFRTLEDVPRVHSSRPTT